LGILILPKEYAITGIRKIIVYHIIVIGNNKKNGRTIARISKGPVDMICYVILNIALIGKIHPDPKRCVPGKIISMYNDTITMIKRNTIILIFHDVIVYLRIFRLIHHHTSTKGLVIICPDRDPTG